MLDVGETDVEEIATALISSPQRSSRAARHQGRPAHAARSRSAPSSGPLRMVQARGIVRVKPGPGGGLFVDNLSPMVRLGNSMMALDKDAVSFPDAVRFRDAIDPLLVDDTLKHERGRTSEPCGLS